MRIQVLVAWLLLLVGIGIGIGGCCTQGSWGDKHGWQCHN